MIEQFNNDEIKKNQFIRKKYREENQYNKADFNEVILSFKNLYINFNINDNNKNTEYIVISTTDKEIFKNDVRTTIRKINKNENIILFLKKNKILRKNLKYIVKRVWNKELFVNHIYFRII